MRRTSPDKEQAVLTSILMGDSYAVVSKKTGVPVSTIKKIKKRSDVQMAQLHAHVIEEQADSVRALLEQANKQISRLLTRADLGLVDISILDLCRISEALHAQTTINSSPVSAAKTLSTVTQKYQ